VELGKCNVRKTKGHEDHLKIESSISAMNIKPVLDCYDEAQGRDGRDAKRELLSLEECHHFHLLSFFCFHFSLFLIARRNW
jgi:hypothetical protein